MCCLVWLQLSNQRTDWHSELKIELSTATLTAWHLSGSGWPWAPFLFAWKKKTIQVWLSTAKSTVQHTEASETSWCEAWQKLTLIKYKLTRRYFFPLSQHLFWQSLHLWLGWRGQLLFQAEQSAHSGMWWIALFISHPALPLSPSSLKPPGHLCNLGLAILSGEGWEEPIRRVGAARGARSWGASEQELRPLLPFPPEHSPASRLLQGLILAPWAAWLSLLPCQAAGCVRKSLIPLWSWWQGKLKEVPAVCLLLPCLAQ